MNLPGTLRGFMTGLLVDCAVEDGLSQPTGCAGPGVLIARVIMTGRESGTREAPGTQGDSVSKHVKYPGFFLNFNVHWEWIWDSCEGARTRKKILIFIVIIAWSLLLLHNLCARIIAHALRQPIFPIIPMEATVTELRGV